MIQSVASHASAAEPDPARLPSAAHLPALDGVRGLAIVLVMFHHFTSKLNPACAVDLFIIGAAQRAFIGVDLFFVLSGFLITGILLDTKNTANYFRSFYARRALRIFPLYYATLAVYFFVMPHLPKVGLDISRAPSQWWYWTYLVNFVFAFQGDAIRPLFMISWSLCIEEQFYLVWPAVVRFSNRRMLTGICISVLVTCPILRAVLATRGTPWLYTYMLTPCRLDGLACGALMALGYRSIWFKSSHTKRLAWLGLAGFGVLAIGFSAIFPEESTAIVYRTVFYSVVAATFACLLALALNCPTLWPWAWLQRRTPRMFGRYSYALYLFHGLVARCVTDPIWQRLRIPALLGSQLPSQLLYWCASVGLSVGIAAASWHLFERRILALKRYFPAAGERR